MAATVSERRSTKARQSAAKAGKAAKAAKPGSAGKAMKPAKPAKPAKAAKAAKAGTAVATKPGGKLARKAGGKLARKAAGGALRATARGATRAGAAAARITGQRLVEAWRRALETGQERRLPIQVSVDVAVPIEFAWEEWTSFETFTEGVHRMEEVERQGDHLVGVTAGPRPSRWRAEIVDEREQQAFAWRSVEGTDCAGLVTFHQLSDRLTRIEVDLDVLPTGPLEMLALPLRVAHRRVEADLRRFKARVEFINPDVYETDADQGSSHRDAATDE
jgi:uncharacterized membrane protein